MSEYMIGYPPRLGDDEEKLWLSPSPDGTNSLFSVLEEQGAIQPVAMEIIEQVPRYSYPESMNELKRQYRARGVARAVMVSTVETDAATLDRDAESQRDTPYSELGGGLGRDMQPRSTEMVRMKSLDENMGIVCRDYQPWMRDIAIGAERYDLLNLTVADAKMMTKADQRKAALYIDGFMEGLKSIRRLVDTHDGVASYHAFFDKYNLPGKGAPSPEEFKAYMATLDAFESILVARGAAQYFVGYAHDEINHSASARARSRKDNKDRKGNTPRIRYDSKLKRHVVELIPRGSGIVPEPY